VKLSTRARYALRMMVSLSRARKAASAVVRQISVRAENIDLSATSGEAPGVMLRLLLAALQTLICARRSQRELARENLALRQQLAMLRGQGARPTLRPADRLFWAGLARLWTKWRDVLIVVRPETVIRWHRLGFKLFWRWKSRSGRRRSERKSTSAEVRALIRKMAIANPLWGAPRVHGERLKLGIDISERTVSRLMPRERKPPSQTWRTFLENHVASLVSTDFFVVPTATLQSPLRARGSRP
jgi:putative transposase